MIFIFYMTNSFDKLKKDFLNKKDKSHAQKIDDRIKSLCNVINERNDMYTLSSCSGRICLLAKSTTKKEKNCWVYITHNKADENEILKKIENFREDKQLEFRQESAIIHINVKTEELAKKLMHKSKESGFNQVGIIAIKENRLTIELICDIIITTPIYEKELKTSKEYIKFLTQKANKNQELSWHAINTLEKEIKKI